ASPYAKSDPGPKGVIVLRVPPGDDPPSARPVSAARDSDLPPPVAPPRRSGKRRERPAEDARAAAKAPQGAHLAAEPWPAGAPGRAHRPRPRGAHGFRERNAAGTGAAHAGGCHAPRGGDVSAAVIAVDPPTPGRAGDKTGPRRR